VESHTYRLCRGSTATIIRIPYISTFNNQADFLYATVDVAIWSTVEPGIGIVAGCVATLRPLLQLILHKAGMRSTAGVNNATSSLPLSTKVSRKNGTAASVDSDSDDFLPIQANTTVTTVTGNAPKSPMWNGKFGSSRNSQDSMNKGIEKKVMVSYSQGSQ